jgi:hypothetical protein
MNGPTKTVGPPLGALLKLLTFPLSGVILRWLSLPGTWQTCDAKSRSESNSRVASVRPEPERETAKISIPDIEKDQNQGY